MVTDIVMVSFAFIGEGRLQPKSMWAFWVGAPKPATIEQPVPVRRLNVDDGVAICHVAAVIAGAASMVVVSSRK